MNGRLIASLISFFVLLQVVVHSYATALTPLFVFEIFYKKLSFQNIYTISVALDLFVVSVSIYLKGIKKSRLFFLYNFILFIFFNVLSLISGDFSGEQGLGIFALPFSVIGYLLVFSVLPAFIYRTIYNNKDVQNWTIIISILLSIFLTYLLKLNILT